MYYLGHRRLHAAIMFLQIYVSCLSLGRHPITLLLFKFPSSFFQYSLNMTQLSKDVEASSNIWQLNDAHDVDALTASLRAQAEHSDILDAIEICVNSSSDDLRKLSIQIHGKRLI